MHWTEKLSMSIRMGYLACGATAICARNHHSATEIDERCEDLADRLGLSNFAADHVLECCPPAGRCVADPVVVRHLQGRGVGALVQG